MVAQTSLRKSLRAYQIYGANTDVGKTIMSTILCKAFAHAFPVQKTYYLKPVSTGPMNEADDGHISSFAPHTKTKCLFQFGEAVSPHIAARASEPLLDTEIQAQVLKHISDCADSGPGTLIVETAGGVHSPTPSGSSQVDLYRPFRLPICLVTDHRLGGISASISAFESLHIRGYDLDAVLQFKDETYQNYSYLQDYFSKKGALSISIPKPPPRATSETEDRQQMADYYSTTSKSDIVIEAVHSLAAKHTARIRDLEEMSKKAHENIWYPFTQHQDVSPHSIMAIDSASGDFFQTHSRPIDKSTHISTQAMTEDVLTPAFDGSASWWTQGLGHGSPELSLAASYAAGRYGHVMFAGTVHKPALDLATTLLSSLRNPRLEKCFFSDNGSTGMEVATKMALTATSKRYNYNPEQKANIGVLGLKGSYHGDTVGAMDCSEPSTFNEKVHWYKGRGYWFDFPQVKHKKGKWILEIPDCISTAKDNKYIEKEFDNLSNVFNIRQRKHLELGCAYRDYIKNTLHHLTTEEGITFGALILEPVLLGAGGMLFCDPLFQHCLVEAVREHTYHNPEQHHPGEQVLEHKDWRGLPVIVDEVFTGLYRLGRFSSSSFIDIDADISVHAKLLTGGLVPLCTTLASQSIYDAFLADEKSDALLHGHSYTAHPIGCHVANTSLKALEQLAQGKEWQAYRDDWLVGDLAEQEAWSVWSKQFVSNISFSQDVESVIALGSVLAINLQDANAGYSSNAAIGLQKRLMKGSTDFKIHVRVLGNVLYIMASQTSKPETLKNIETLLESVLL